VVTAGGTQEPIDPVRVIANRSSGKQGFALAQVALEMGAQVTLITGPVSMNTPVGAERIDVRTASEMLAAVQQSILTADILIMAAAVADFRPAETAKNKIKKNELVPIIRLEKTTDILAEVAQRKADSGRPIVVVGFAAESEDLLANAQAKLLTKRLDLIVANDIRAEDAGFGTDTNRVILLSPGKEADPLPLMSKEEVSEIILERVVRLIASTQSLE